jgi:hypothetical protein
MFKTVLKKWQWWLAFFAIVVIAAWVRLAGLTQIPPALYWEEVALGYDAWSLLKTGKDHHGHPWPVVAAESFGDWKPTGYLYALLPTLSIFGLSEFAVRLPSALAGIAIVIGVGYLIHVLCQKETSLTEDCVDESWLVLGGMALTAVSPWAIQVSRVAFETNLATASILWGGSVLLSAANLKRHSWLKVLVGVALLAFALYTYHAARIVVPLLAVGIAGWWWPHMRQNGKKFWRLVVGGLVLAVILSLPLALSLTSVKTQQRFAETSIFSDVSVIEKSNQFKELSGNTWWSKVFYHRYILFSGEMVKNALKHADLKYLVISGDENPRHSIQMVGALYYVTGLGLILGVLYLTRQSSKVGLFLGYWCLVGIMPATITLAAPHLLRTESMMPILMVVATLGSGWAIKSLGKWLGTQKVLKRLLSNATVSPTWLILIIVLGIYGVEVIHFGRAYTSVYPKLQAQAWQYGYPEMLEQLSQFQKSNPETRVFISRVYGRPAMYYWFYNQISPERVQAAEVSAKKDQGEFLEFENISFVNSSNEVTSPGVVALNPEDATALQARAKSSQILGEVKDPRGETVWLLVSVMAL